MHGHTAIRVDPLVIVTTSVLPDELTQNVAATNIRHPVICEPTAEAILLQGSLVQLGDEAVTFATEGIAHVPRPDIIVCRLPVFKDETFLDWASFVVAPLRELIKHAPGLSLCKDTACNQSCGKFHQALEDNVDRLFLDVWGRAFSKVGGGREKPLSAAALHRASLQ